MTGTEPDGDRQMRIIIEDKVANRAARLEREQNRRDSKCERRAERRAKSARRNFFAFG